jgi:hypothetical protein
VSDELKVFLKKFNIPNIHFNVPQPFNSAFQQLIFVMVTKPGYLGNAGTNI